MSNNDGTREEIRGYQNSIQSLFSRGIEFNLSLIETRRGYTVTVIRDENSIRVSSHIGTEHSRREFRPDSQGIKKALEVVSNELAKW